jgi:Arc/MetJ-type ribon-helix-helix transcriptional regulator
MYIEGKENFRIGTKQQEKIKKIITKLPNKYDNVSHFIRCAIIKLIREEEG